MVIKLLQIRGAGTKVLEKLTDLSMSSPSKNYSPSTQRGSDTHQKVINAGIHCIAELGFQAASTNKIASEAQVTWGVLQHQFGDKGRLLEAILEACFDQQMEKITRSISTQQDLKERINSLIEVLWENQLTEPTLALQEILYGVMRDPKLRERFIPTLIRLRDFYDEQWRYFFKDVDISTEHLEGIKELTFGALRGLAYDINVRSSDKAILRAKELLKQQILWLFTEGNKR